VPCNGHGIDAWSTGGIAEPILASKSDIIPQRAHSTPSRRRLPRRPPSSTYRHHPPRRMTAGCDSFFSRRLPLRAHGSHVEKKRISSEKLLNTRAYRNRWPTTATVVVPARSL